jgi:hypothetical protein
LLAGLVWCGNCGERIGIRADRRVGEVPRDFYRCRGRRIRKQCDLPHIPREELDEAVRETFVRQFVDSMDLQRTIERERERLLYIRSEQAGVMRDEIAEVEARLAEDVAFRERFNDDYARGSITPDQWSRLEAEVGGRVEQAEAALANLRSTLSDAEGDLPTADIDRLLDHLNSLKRLVVGTLTAEKIPP